MAGAFTNLLLVLATYWYVPLMILGAVLVWRTELFSKIIPGKGATKKRNATLIGLLLVGGAVGLLFGTPMGSELLAIIPEGEEPLVPITDCEYAPSVTFNGFDALTFDTITDEYVCYRAIGNIGWICGNLGTAVELSPITYEVVVAGNGTTGSASYYGSHHEVIIGCVPTLVIDEPLYGVIATADVTEVILNSNGQPNDVLSANQTMTAGTMKTLSIEITGDKDKATSNIDCYDKGVSSVLMISYNDTEYDAVTSAELGASISCPKKTSVAEISDVCFNLPPIIGTSSYAFHLTFDIDDDIGGASTITGTVYDAQNYINSDDNEVYCDVENEDQTSVGLPIGDSETFSIYCASS